MSEEDLLDEQLRFARLSGPAARKPPAEKPGSAPHRRSTLGYLSPTDYEDRPLIDSGASLASGMPLGVHEHHPPDRDGHERA